MNVAFGGSLIQHLPDDSRYRPHGTPSGADGLLHDVEVVPDSRLVAAVGATRSRAPRTITRGSSASARGIAVTARSDDGLPEAIEREGDGWMLGVQWHPGGHGRGGRRPAAVVRPAGRAAG